MLRLEDRRQVAYWMERVSPSRVTVRPSISNSWAGAQVVPGASMRGAAPYFMGAVRGLCDAVGGRGAGDAAQDLL